MEKLFAVTIKSGYMKENQKLEYFVFADSKYDVKKTVMKELSKTVTVNNPKEHNNQMNKIVESLKIKQLFF